MIISNLSSADYHASHAVSKTMLDKIARSPAHLAASREQKQEPTDAMVFGSAFHDFILLPDTFQTAYTVIPDDINPRTKDGKAFIAEIQASGKTVLKAEWVEAIQAMAASIRAHPKATALLSSGKAEQSVFWTDDNTGVECRCRPDFWHSSGILVDLKSTLDASPKSFAKSVANLRYHVQDAFYCNGVYQVTGEYPKGFVFIAVEKTPPYAVACYTLEEAAKSLGQELYERDLKTYQTAAQLGQWLAYSPDIETLSLPAWAYRTE